MGQIFVAFSEYLNFKYVKLKGVLERLEYSSTTLIN